MRFVARSIGDSDLIVGYVLVGTFAGLLAFVFALLFGASFWVAFALYALVGSAGVILLPTARMVAGILASHAKTPIVTDRWNETGSPRLACPSASEEGVVIDTSMRILAVDDDPFILELIPIISAKAGFSDVTPAASGEQALELLRDPGMFFDCLLLDICMPGMDGVELCRRARRIPRYRRTPIVMLTAMRDLTNMGDAYRAGASDYATKPFDIEELGKRLRLAQEAIREQREKGSVSNYGFELPNDLRSDGAKGLVDHTILSNYLTQLPRKEMTDIQVFAIRIDGLEVIHTRSSPQQFIFLLQDVAAAAVDCFGADRTVMAYAQNATLLIATNSVVSQLSIDIENNIERLLRSDASEYVKDLEIGVSVGGPVQPQASKAERARMATDRVIALAENRALDKQGRQVAGLFKR